MKATPEQIAVVEKMRDGCGFHSDPTNWLRADALTAVLNELRASREVIEQLAKLETFKEKTK